MNFFNFRTTPREMSSHRSIGLALTLSVVAVSGLSACGGETDKNKVEAATSTVKNPVDAPADNSATSPGSETPATSQPSQAMPENTTAGKAAAVNGERIAAANSEPGAWLSHGRTYDEQRHSPLAQVNDKNVDQLALSWHYKLDVDRGVEASPIVVDGTMYTSGAYSIVYALDAKTGALKWKYNPEVPAAAAGRGCCGPVNRGVAVWNGKVFIGAYDGRLIALDARDGKQVWSVDTVEDKRFSYTVTGAPRVVKGKVLIGNGGAELGARGYISAYDAETGKRVWRFYTVPGDPDKPSESEALAKAKDTWFGGKYHEQGGGGTVWDSMAYDPELDLLYFGVGNGSPWNIKYRSDGKGDNLYLSSIVAVKPDTGEYVWHYQTTPGDSWDYTATQHIVLADIELNGQLRKVLMQAPKNGFFYVIDRQTGKLLSANNYVPMNWASGIDMETGRPILTGEGDYSNEPKLITPGPLGGHNWQPMSYNPTTGLVYIPAQITALLYEDLGQRPSMAPNAWNVGLAPFQVPEDKEGIAGLDEISKGMLLAWDPVTQQAKWSVPHEAPWNGGTLTTAGNLVFQGNAEGKFTAYAADSGKLLWETPANTGVIAAPISYEIDGEQYVAVSAGWGGTFALVANGVFEPKIKVLPEARILVYKLGGKATLPPAKNRPKLVPEPPELAVGEAEVQIGRDLYNGYCATCHGLAAIGGGSVPDLRYMKSEVHEIFPAIVAGAYIQRGMPSFAQTLPPEYVGLIHQYLIKRGHDLLAATKSMIDAPTGTN